MTTPTQLVKQSWPMEEEPTADSVARVVKSLLIMPVTSKSISIDAPETQSGKVTISWEAYIPAGVPPTARPQDTYEALLKLQLIEAFDVESNVSMIALRAIHSLLTMARERSLVGVGLLVGNEKNFRRWSGMDDDDKPSFLNMQIIEHDQLPEDSVVLLAGKGVCDPLDAVSAIIYRFGGEDGEEESEPESK